MKIFDEEVYFNSFVRFFVLPKVYVDLIHTHTTPSVLNRTILKSPSSPITVTNFDDGAQGQTIRILGNGNLTVAHNSNIKTNTGANKILAADKVYNFTLIDEVWYEGA